MQVEVKISGSGVVRDAEGNIVSQEPVEAVLVMSEDKAAELIKSLERDQK